MWSLIFNNNGIMKYYNKYRNIFVTFNKENEKIVSIDVLYKDMNIRIEEQGFFYIKEIIGRDYDIYKFIMTILEREERKRI